MFTTKNIFKTDVFVVIIISIFFLIRLFELKNVGETWDEEPKVRNGQIHIKAISSLDFSTEIWKIHRMHPPLGKIILALPTYVQKINTTRLETDKYYNEGKNYFLSRVIALIFSSITLFLTYKITKLITNFNYGVISVIILALMPHFIAHEFISTLESIQLTFLTFLIYLLANGRIGTFKQNFLIGTVLGALLLIKFSSVIFLGLPFLYLILNRFSWHLTTRTTLKVLIPNAVIIITAFILFYAFWPWIWPNPYTRLIETMSSLLREARTEIFLGGYSELPWYYFLFYFVITTPLAYLIMLGIACFFLFKNYKKNLLIIFIFAAFLIPFLTSFSGFKQNGIRYLYTSFSNLSIIITWGLFILNKNFSKNISIVLTVVLILSTITANLKITPYYLDYYNEIVGGTKNVYEKKIAQIGWWGEGSLEMVRFINTSLPKNSRICLDFIPRHVVPRFRDDIKTQVDCLYEKDYLLINNMYIQQTRIGKIDQEHELIYTVKADGADLVNLYKINHRPKND